MSLYVQKYGGSSVGSLERIQTVAQHIARTYAEGHDVLVVVSAMGEQTDELLAMATQINPMPPQRELDMLLSTGERVTMALLAIALNALSVPTVSFTGSQSGIITDNNFGNAKIMRVLGDRIRAALNQKKIVIVAGFQGVSEKDKEVTTLGRGGSDLTAIALAHTFAAQACQIFKDVDGICTANPKLVPKANVISNMSWDSLSHLTWFGSEVVHNRGVHLAKTYQIPLEIRSSFNFEKKGTKIGFVTKMEKAAVHAITHREDLLWVFVRGMDPVDSVSLLKYLSDRGESPFFFQQISSPEKSGLECIISQKILTYPDEQNILYKNDKIEKMSGSLTCVSIIGHGFCQDVSVLNQALQCLRIKPTMTDCKNSVINFYFSEKLENIGIETLHEVLFENPIDV